MVNPDLKTSGIVSEEERKSFHWDLWFVHMRWIACAVSAALICLAVWVLEYLGAEVFWPLAMLVTGLLITNIFFDQCIRQKWLRRYLQEVQICSDLFFLTAMLHYSGGIENPAMLVYAFHIIISGILLNRRKCYATVVLASGLFGAVALAEMSGIIEHYTLQVFPHPEEAHGFFHAAHQPVYVSSVVAVQAVLLSLTAYFTTTIMERLRAEEKRAMADRQRLQRALEATGAGFTILDKQLRPVLMNKQIKNWLNASEEIIGHGSPEFSQWTGGQNSPAARTFKDGDVRTVERQVNDAHGNRRLFQVTVAPLTDQAGQVYQVVELTQDITRRKLFEAEMMHSEKMAALGFLAAGVAHEVGNPLASISVRLRLLKDHHDETFVQESLQLLQNQIDRITRTIRGVSQFARPSNEEWVACRVNEIVNETLKMLGFHKQAKRCRIIAELGDNLPETTGVKDQLIQVFLNLGLNALEAMPRGGTLTIRTCCVGNDIVVEFIDSGGGIDNKIRDRIFDPFFTTKETGQGLGLSIIQNIVDAHGGRIEVESNQGHGSVFSVALPIRTSQDPLTGKGKAAAK